VVCSRPGPNLRFTCCAGTCWPGRTIDMGVWVQNIRFSLSSFTTTTCPTDPCPPPCSMTSRSSLISRKGPTMHPKRKDSRCICRREDLEDLLTDPVYFQAIFHSLSRVKSMYQSQAELGMANESIASALSRYLRARAHVSYFSQNIIWRFKNRSTDYGRRRRRRLTTPRISRRAGKT
jgi:hypothetical protein